MSCQPRALGQIPLYQDSNQHANDCNLYAAHSGRDQIYIYIFLSKNPFISLMHRSVLSVFSYRHHRYINKELRILTVKEDFAQIINIRRL